MIPGSGNKNYTDDEGSFCNPATSTKTSPKTERPQVQQKPKKQEKPKKEDASKRISLEFLAEVSTLCQVPTADVRKVMEAIRKYLLNQMKANSLMPYKIWLDIILEIRACYIHY